MLFDRNRKLYLDLENRSSFYDKGKKNLFVSVTSVKKTKPEMTTDQIFKVPSPFINTKYSSASKMKRNSGSGVSTVFRPSFSFVKEKLSTHSNKSFGLGESPTENKKKESRIHFPISSFVLPAPQEEKKEETSKEREEIERLKKDKQILRGEIYELKKKMKEITKFMVNLKDQNKETEQRAIDVIEALKEHSNSEVKKLKDQLASAFTECLKWKERAIHCEMKMEMSEKEFENLPKLTQSLFDFRYLMEKMSELVQSGDLNHYKSTFYDLKSMIEKSATVQNAKEDFSMNLPLQNLSSEIRYLYSELKKMHKSIEKTCC